MDLHALKKRLDEIAWLEQADEEIRERPGSAAQRGGAPAPGGADAAVRALAASVPVAMLDALESEPGYLAWALRLAPHADPPGAAARARRHLRSPDAHVRHWARSVTP